MLEKEACPMHRALVTSIVVFGVLAAACEKDNKAATTTTAAQQPPATATPTPQKTAEPAPAKKEPAVTWKGIGLATPESVLHDADADVYLVSNVDGEPLAADGKGFIAKLTPDGKVDKLKWIESGKDKV